MEYFGAYLGGILGCLGGVIGSYFSIKNTNGPLEKSFMVKCVIWGWLAITLFLGLMYILPHPYRYFLWIPYGICLPLGIRFCNRRQQEIRASETTE